MSKLPWVKKKIRVLFGLQVKARARSQKSNQSQNQELKLSQKSNQNQMRNLVKKIIKKNKSFTKKDIMKVFQNKGKQTS